MIAPGLHVKVHYTGTLDDGTVFDSSRKRNEPLEFVMGDHKTLFAFEQAVARLAEGASCKIRLSPDEAYGEYRENQLDTVPLASFGSRRPPLGQYIQMRVRGRVVRAKVVSIEGDSVTLDYNHPLAGQYVNFEITLLEVERKSALEQEQDYHSCDCHRVAESLSAAHGQHHHHHSHACC